MAGSRSVHGGRILKIDAPPALQTPRFWATVREQGPGLVRLLRPPPVLSAAATERLRAFEQALGTWVRGLAVPPPLRLRPVGPGCCEFCGDRIPQGWQCAPCRDALSALLFIEHGPPRHRRTA